MDNSTDFSHHFTEYMQIKIFVDSADVELKNKYISSAFAHNEKILQNPTDFQNQIFILVLLGIITHVVIFIILKIIWINKSYFFYCKIIIWLRMIR